MSDYDYSGAEQRSVRCSSNISVAEAFNQVSWSLNGNVFLNGSLELTPETTLAGNVNAGDQLCVQQYGVQENYYAPCILVIDYEIEGNESGFVGGADESQFTGGGDDGGFVPSGDDGGAGASETYE
eukprot:TRINITY_DN11014_c0_g1_i1.p1 TRINITY_DN11014_c0_g1~~TRINITY_DN11014_c0_g1_i1.p1  ORF type:complete len:126 (-),score=30.44 TRINITY_DN11014_c0_g1_i1:127-504(-)